MALAKDRVAPDEAIGGRVVDIQINPKDSVEPYWLDPEKSDSPIVFEFSGYHNCFVRVYDHRSELIRIFEDYSELRYRLAESVYGEIDISDDQMMLVAELIADKAYLSCDEELLAKTRKARDEFLKAFLKTPCLASYRIKNGSQYFVLCDLGVHDIYDNGDQSQIILTKTTTYDRNAFCVLKGNHLSAIHLATRICLAVPRPIRQIAKLEQ